MDHLLSMEKEDLEISRTKKLAEMPGKLYEEVYKTLLSFERLRPRGPLRDDL